MNKQKILALKDQYAKELFENVAPFWVKYAPDRQYGGIFHNVQRDGSLYSTDKCVWFQGRGTWTFSKLYNDFGQKQEWLEIAKSGYDFLVRHCFDDDGRMYFEMSREGRPLRKRRYWFSEAFAIGGMAEYSKASGDADALRRAKQLFKRILFYYQNPGILPPKYITKNFKVKNHNTCMILISTAQILRETEKSPSYDPIIDGLINDLTDFIKPEKRALLECVSPNGEMIDSPMGRRINPGHAMETASFLLNEAQYRNDSSLRGKAADIIKWAMERGWDSKYGGIFNYVDLDDKPSDKVEWDMKYWWTHAEALYANLLAFYLTKDPEFENNYDKLHKYTFSHFPDYSYGEWFGYLHRDGSICLTAKGSTFKGPFHIPRFLMNGLKLLERMEKECPDKAAGR